jgi:outer membrane protein OmpA-like peptidoglycan-associated protein
MKSLRSKTASLALAAGFIGLLCFGSTANAQLVWREEIVRALTLQPAALTRSLSLGNRRYYSATAQTKPAIELHEIYFEFNSAAIADDAEPQMRELGAALSDPRLKGSTISISGHTDAVGSNAFNYTLSERRAAAVKWYLVNNFQIPAASLHSVGYGKLRPKNKLDVFAAENRRVEIVNEEPGFEARR